MSSNRPWTRSSPRHVRAETIHRACQPCLVVSWRSLFSSPPNPLEIEEIIGRRIGRGEYSSLISLYELKNWLLYDSSPAIGIQSCGFCASWFGPSFCWLNLLSDFPPETCTNLISPADPLLLYGGLRDEEKESPKWGHCQEEVGVSTSYCETCTPLLLLCIQEARGFGGQLRDRD